jgi:hypothetical protein
MKTFFVTLLKILLVAVLFWLLLQHAPFIVAPVIGAVGAALLLALGGVVALGLGLSVGLTAVVLFLAVAFSIAVALAPVWVPILAIVGLVALCRPNRTVA